MVSMSSGATVRGSISSTEIPSAARSLAGFRTAWTIRASATTVTSRPFADDGRPAEFDLVIVLGNRPLDAQDFAVFQEEDRDRRSGGPVATAPWHRRELKEPRRGGREMGEHRVIVARMMRGRRVADADAAAEQDRHLEPAAAHVLDLGDLVDDLADGVEDEIGEHEVDHRPRAGHGRAAAEADESALADRRVAEPDRAVSVDKPGGCVEVAAALADPLAHHEDRRVRGPSPRPAPRALPA